MPFCILIIPLNHIFVKGCNLKVFGKGVNSICGIAFLWYNGIKSEIRMVKDSMQRIKSLRENRDWTQSDLERESGVAQAHISRLEAGKAPNVSITVLSQIADALNTTLDYLTNRSDDPSPRPIANHPALTDPRFSYLAQMWALLPPYAQDHLARQVKLMERLNPDLRAAMAERGWDLPDAGEK